MDATVAYLVAVRCSCLLFKKVLYCKIGTTGPAAVCHSVIIVKQEFAKNGGKRQQAHQQARLGGRNLQMSGP